MSGFSNTTKFAPNQSPYFSGTQQIIASGALPAQYGPYGTGPLNGLTSGVQTPNTTPVYNGSLFTPSSSTRAAALANPASIANPVGSVGPSTISGSGPGTNSPAGLTGVSLGTTGTPSTSGMTPAQILIQMLSNPNPNNSGGIDTGTNIGTGLPGAGGSPAASVTPSGYVGATSSNTTGTATPTSLGGINYTPASEYPTDTFQSWLDQMFAQPNALPGAPAIAPLPGLDVALSPGATIDPNAASATDALGGAGLIGPNGAAIDPSSTSFAGLMQALTASANADATSQASGGGVGGQPAIVAPTVSTAGENVQTLDQILQTTTGANSSFANSILPALTSQFNQANAETAAAAKESAGNLTGSGFANTLGTALNRNTATQQTTLANTMTALAQAEQSRQQASANINATQNQQNASMNLTAQTTSAQLAQQAQALAEQARSSGRADLLAQSQLLMQQATTQAQLEQQNSQFNAGSTNTANTDYFNAGVNRNTQQALTQNQDWLAQFAAANNMSAQNAQAFANFLQMIFGGGSGTNVNIPGMISSIPGLTGLLTALAVGG